MQYTTPQYNMQYTTPQYNMQSTSTAEKLFLIHFYLTEPTFIQFILTSSDSIRK